MELIGNLKDKVEKAKSKEEARGLIEGAGMRLSTDELDMVAGGFIYNPANIYGTDPLEPNDYKR